MAGKKKYDKEYKVQAVKLGREEGFSKAAQELGISVDTLYGWIADHPEARFCCSDCEDEFEDRGGMKNRKKK